MTDNANRDALNDSAYTAIQDGVEPVDWLKANRDAVLKALGAKLAGWGERLDGQPHAVWLIPKEAVTDE